MKRWVIITLIVVVLGGGAYLGIRQYQKLQANSQNLFETTALVNGDLTATVGATGTVRSNQSGILLWQTTGTVLASDLKVGDVVSAGQVLAVLDPNSLPQTIILAQSDLVTAQRFLDNLMDSKTAQAQALQTMANAQKAYDDAKTRYEGLAYPRGSQFDIDKAYSDVQLAQTNLAEAQLNFDRVKDLPDYDVRKNMALNQLSQAQISLNRASATWQWLRGKPTPNDMAVAESNYEVAKAQLADAQREWERLKDGPDPKDIAAAQARVAAIAATLEMRHLKAPFAATITEKRVAVGDQVSPGTTAFRIDDLSHLLVDVQVSEVDINRVKIGQTATMTFDAIAGKTYNGKVTQVGRVGNNLQGVVDFTVTVEITDADAQVRPGMTAAVNMVVQQMKNILLVPNRAVRINEGDRVVFIMKNNIPTQVKITLGASSDTDSQVISGDVKAGDLIIINPPLALMGKPGNGGFMGGGR